VRRRLDIFALLVFQAIWLNVIVPGHTRGVVTLAGTSPAVESCHAVAKTKCCPSKGTSDDEKSDSESPVDEGERKANCAVCYFAARIAPPPAVDLLPSPLEIVRPSPPVPSHLVDSLDTLPTYYGRGPPRT
jgi:hypothetical protein